MDKVRRYTFRPECLTMLIRNPQWYPEVLHFCPSTPLILVGLKSDLRSKRTCIELLKTQGLTPVTSEQGQAVAARMGAMYIECSSKEMNNVEEVFEMAVNVVVDVEEEELAYASGAIDPNTRGLEYGAGNGFTGNGNVNVGVRGSTIADRSMAGGRNSAYSSPAVARRATVAGMPKDTSRNAAGASRSTGGKSGKMERKTMGGKKIKKRQCVLL